MCLCTIVTVSFFHFFPHNNLSLPIQSTLFNAQFFCSVRLSQWSLFHFFPHNTSYFSIQLAVCTHTLSAMFHFHSAPYFTSSNTKHFPSPLNQLFVQPFYLLCSIVTVLLTSFLPSHYIFPLHPVSCLYPHIICYVPLSQCSFFQFFPLSTNSFSIHSTIFNTLYLLCSPVTVILISLLPHTSYTLSIQTPVCNPQFF
jgi:hypothetical protein